MQNDRTSRPRADKLAFRRSALIEIMLFLAIAAGVDLAFFAGDRFWEVYPHPFWILVLLITVQYGTNEGLMAAVAASLALLLGNMPEQSVYQDLYAYLLEVSTRPLLWCTAAIALGELREKQMTERDALREELNASEHRATTLASAYDTLKRHKGDLEIRIAGAPQTLIDAIQAACRMTAAREEDILSAAADIIRKTVNPGAFSLYLPDGDTLSLKHAHGWDEATASYATAFAPGSALYQAVMVNGECVHIARETGEKILDDQGVLVCPLTCPEEARPIGMLKIEQLDFTKLTISNVALCEMLGRWIGAAIVRAQQSVAPAPALFHPRHRLHTGQFFAHQSRYLEGLAKRIGFDASMVTVTLTNAGELTESEYSNALEALRETVEKTLRYVDQAFETPESDSDAAILLPNTAKNDVTFVITKLKQSLEKRLEKTAPHAAFEFDTKVLHSA